MAELLVRVTDKVNPDDFYLNTKCTKRGDVIVVQPDGWAWGAMELSAPFWRIIKHSDLTVTEARALLAPELDTDPQHPSRTLQRRKFWLNLFKDAFPVALKNWLADDTRAVPMLDLTPVFSLTNFRGLKEEKPPIDDPNVIG
jgi:hypothetical protein